MKRFFDPLVLLTVLAIAGVGFASVTVSSPANGATIQSPVAFVASASSHTGITGMAIYVDSQKVYSTSSANLKTSVPMLSGRHSIVVKAWTSQGRIYSDTMTLEVTASTPATLQLTTSSMTNATVGSSYSTTLQATGSAPYSWSLVSGSLPSGLTLSNAGIVSGTPSASGNFSFTVQVTDSASTPQMARRTESILVSASLLSVSAATIPTATAGKAYTTTLAAKGGALPYLWSIASGQLPPGVTLSAAGVISGTPNVPGAYTFTVDVKDSAALPQTASYSENISVASAQLLSINATTLSAATAGSPYAATLTARGGIPTYTWSIVSGTIPTGLTLSSSGVISGTPSVAGTFSSTVQVRDAEAPQQSASSVENIVVAPVHTTVIPPPQAAGYNLMFSDDFANLDISPNREGAYNWYPGIWWNSAISPASDTTASNSILTLNWKAGQGTTSTDVSACSQNGSNCHAFRYGYFEARMKWDPATGSWPAFWLLPVEDVTGADVNNGVRESGEIDVFEGQGATPLTYFGSIHDWKNNVDVHNNNNSNAHQLASTVDVTQYHTYGVLWVPGTISWYFDNQLLGSAATDAIFDQQTFYPILSSQEGVNWLGGNMTGVTASTIPLSVDWIHAFQK